MKDIQSVRLVRDPSVAGHGSGTKDDIALAITIKEEDELSQFVLKTLMQDVEAVAERLRLAIDNAKSGQVSKRIEKKKQSESCICYLTL